MNITSLACHQSKFSLWVEWTDPDDLDNPALTIGVFAQNKYISGVGTLMCLASHLPKLYEELFNFPKNLSDKVTLHPPLGRLSVQLDFSVKDSTGLCVLVASINNLTSGNANIHIEFEPAQFDVFLKQLKAMADQSTGEAELIGLPSPTDE